METLKNFSLYEKTPHYFKGIIIKNRITVIVSSADMDNIDYFINLTDFEGIGALV